MVGRPCVNKHQAYNFHRPSALWIAQIIVDLEFASVQSFVFSVMVYFMCHLVRDAGVLPYFLLGHRHGIPGDDTIFPHRRNAMS